MKGLKDEQLFQTVHDYLCIYLPKMKRYSENTIRSYRGTLSSLLDYAAEQAGVSLSQVSFALITYEVLSGFLDGVEKRGASVTTRNQRLQAVRSFYNYASMIDPALMIYRNEIYKVPAKKKAENEVIDFLSEEETKILLEQPDPTTEKGLRDLFILVLLYDSAARVQELVDIRICDLRTDKTPTLRLHGKGAKTRIVPLMNSTIRHYKKYMGTFHPEEDAASAEYLFYNDVKGTRKKLDTSTVRKMVRHYGDQARETKHSIPENLHPHHLRHSRAMHLYQHGMDLTLISQWLGHAQMETTLIYAHADTEQKRKAIEQATSATNVLKTEKDTKRFVVSDDDMIRKLYGLK